MPLVPAHSKRPHLSAVRLLKSKAASEEARPRSLSISAPGRCSVSACDALHQKQRNEIMKQIFLRVKRGSQVFFGEPLPPQERGPALDGQAGVKQKLARRVCDISPVSKPEIIT